MEDIIFAGTSTRKPLNFAEVTLVLDNSCQSLPIDYEEVSITRRVYRTGDSEYLINKQKVRLKFLISRFCCINRCDFSELIYQFSYMHLILYL